MNMQPRQQSRFYLGLDLGQARDFSATAIAERRVETTGCGLVTFAPETTTRVIVHHLKRIPLRTPHPQVVERVQALAHDPVFEHDRLEIVIDSTGVGAVIRDLLRDARLGVSQGRNIRLIPVTLTGGEQVNYLQGDVHSVPRHDLLSNLRVFLEKRMLTIAVRGPAAEALRTELLRWGTRSAHDDLIFAVPLACWRAGTPPRLLHGAGPIPHLFPASPKASLDQAPRGQPFPENRIVDAHAPALVDAVEIHVAAFFEDRHINRDAHDAEPFQHLGRFPVARKRPCTLPASLMPMRSNVKIS